jgi:serine phosphatase RsbU (regulator of sigma subunit)
VHYRYEPASEIGGDFLFIRPLAVPPAETIGRTMVVVIDVTGHGVPAALAVSRLHDELSRMYAEGAWASPSEVAAGLNRFVLTNLAPQRVYATAAIVECDSETGAVRYANAGHPPSLLRKPGGLVKRLEPTAPMLGVLEAEVFAASEREEALAEGASVIVYTDGAIDARSTELPESALGVEGVERAVRQAERGEPGAIAGAVMHAVDTHRAGEPADDTLIVEIRRVAAPDSEITASVSSR